MIYIQDGTAKALNAKKLSALRLLPTRAFCFMLICNLQTIRITFANLNRFHPIEIPISRRASRKKLLAGGDGVRAKLKNFFSPRSLACSAVNQFRELQGMCWCDKNRNEEVECATRVLACLSFY